MKEIIHFGNPDIGAAEQAVRCLEDAEFFALMADNHKGYGMPVGGIAVYKNKISPAGVGEVYKSLKEVLKLHKNTIEVIHTLKPLIVCMAGSEEFDPYKD